jgi:peptide/nickel transport system permease protein
LKTDINSPADDDASASVAHANTVLSGVDDLAGITVVGMSPGRQAFRRFLEHKGAVISTVLLFILVMFVILSPITARYGINEQVFKISKGNNVNLSPRKVAWFGTDEVGHDLYSLIIYGVRVSLVIGTASALVSVLLGAVIGAVAGMRGGLFDDIMMRITDIFLAFPLIVSLLVMRNVLSAVSWVKPLVGPTGSVRFLVILFVIFGWMVVARLVRAQVMSLKEREFVEAARAVGATQTRIVARHIIPNSIGPLLVSLSLGVVGAIGAEATLSLFGYGPNPGSGQTSLGLLVAGARESVKGPHWWLSIFPIGVLVILTLCISFIGDGLRDATDPKSSQGRA